MKPLLVIKLCVVEYTKFIIFLVKLRSFFTAFIETHMVSDESLALDYGTEQYSTVQAPSSYLRCFYTAQTGSLRKALFLKGKRQFKYLPATVSTAAPSYDSLAKAPLYCQVVLPQLKFLFDAI